MTTRADSFFNPIQRQPLDAKRIKAIIKSPAYIVERQSQALSNQPWVATLDPYASSRAHANRKFRACVDSTLLAYYRCRFRVRRLRDNHISCEANHNKMK